MKPAAVFLDRDGVITPALPKNTYLTDESGIVFDPKVIEALKILVAKKIPLFIFSNQSCVGQGILSEERCNALHARIIKKLAERNIPIKDSRLCPHVDADDCACRKPKPGMILDLCNAHGLDPKRTAVIGDTERDVIAGEQAGAGCLILLHSSWPIDPVPLRTIVVPTLLESIPLLLTHSYV